MREVIITTVYKDLTRKTIFLRGVLVSSSIIWTGTRYDLEILCSGGKRVKTKIWGLRSGKGKTGREAGHILDLYCVRLSNAVPFLGQLYKVLF